MLLLSLSSSSSSSSSESVGISGREMASPSGYCGEADNVAAVVVVFDARFICVGRAAAALEEPDTVVVDDDEEATTVLLPPAVVFMLVGSPVLPLPSANGILAVANFAMSTASEDFDVGYCTCD